jgi:hypothetical protein
MERNLRAGLEVRPPVVVKKNPPRKREGESGATAAFLLSKDLGEQRSDGQPNRPSAPESHSLFSAASGLKMGTSLGCADAVGIDPCFIRVQSVVKLN